MRPILTILSAGTNPIHNKKPKKKVVEEDEDDKAHKLKLAAGKTPHTAKEESDTPLTALRQTRRLARSWPSPPAARRAL